MLAVQLIYLELNDRKLGDSLQRHGCYSTLFLTSSRDYTSQTTQQREPP